MKLVLSPAKSLDFESKVSINQNTEACFLKQSERLNKLLKKKSAKSLSKLMKISDNLGQLNYQRNQDWQLPFTQNNSRQAAFAFSGDVYRGLDAYTIPKEKIETLQNTVRIISGLYGLLKPIDLIQPYRLEMGTKFANSRGKNLYEFWDTHASVTSEAVKNDAYARSAITTGVSYHVAKGAVFKADYQMFQNQAKGSLSSNQFNLGIGVWF